MSQAIPFLDLTAQYRALQTDLDAAIGRVLASGQFILGPEGEALEQEIAAYCGSAHAVGVANGTDALELALRACGIGAGEEVITSAFSFFATAEAILAVGAVPVFVDITLPSYGLDPAAVEQAVTPKTRAVVPVHLYGHPCAIEPLVQLAAARKLRVIEDCAQAIGASVGSRRVGSFGDAGCFSFYPTKNLGAYGDAGMVVTKDAGIAEQVRLLRAHGSRERYRHEAVGMNSRLDELQAAILRVKLGHLDRWNDARRRIAGQYDAQIQSAGLAAVVRPAVPPEAASVYHLYTVQAPERDRVSAALAAQGIGTQVAYPSILPEQPALPGQARRGGPWPVASAAARRVLSLPIYPELSVDAVGRVVRALASALSS